MCRVSTKVHGDMISVKNYGDILCFKEFDEAYAFAVDPIIAEPVEIIEVHGMPPGPQFERFFPNDRQAIEVALDTTIPFKE